MNSEQFARIFDKQVQRCSETLLGKAAEYATDDDRLHNFNTAAALTGETPQQALGGFMVKHTVSVYDLIADEPNKHDMALWDEKITDHINYLILLKAVITEAAEQEDGQLYFDLVANDRRVHTYSAKEETP